ncbi:hypothetical protein LCGC14_2719060 [marine sediment metagenome]|uniref:Uncharacterized protein n=1 Tax=marine sediment metagenome TaxID=412755 RepID=A0A0F9C2D3_9ZZZZ
MSEGKGSRVVVTDAEDKVERIKTDSEIVKENEELEAELKGKEKTKKQQLEEILAEKKARKKKEKAKKEKEAMTVMLVDSPDRALNWGCVGVGQAGSKIAEVFYNYGYNTVAINSALQDLKPIQIPERQKLFLDYALGGAGKDLSNGREAVEQYRDEVLKHVKKLERKGIHFQVSIN